MKILATVLGLALAATAFSSTARAEKPAEETALTDHRPHYMCYGEYDGTYSNGVRARFYLNGYHLTIRIGDYVFTGPLRCDSWGRRGARISYRVSNIMVPGEVYGRGRILVGHGMSSIEIEQNNGLTFNGWHR